MNYEQEEEYLTNDLSRKLAQVAGEGILSPVATNLPPCVWLYGQACAGISNPYRNVGPA